MHRRSIGLFLSTRQCITGGQILASLGAFSLWAIAGCQGGTHVVGGGSLTSFQSVAQAAQSLAGDWNLSSIEGTEISKLIPDALLRGGKVPSLSFAPDGGVSGFTGVNRLNSKLDLQSLTTGDFKLSPAALTRMAGPPELMNIESRFTSLLAKVDGFNLKGEVLSLVGDGNQRLLEFVKAR